MLFGLVDMMFYDKEVIKVLLGVCILYIYINIYLKIYFEIILFMY